MSSQLNTLTQINLDDLVSAFGWQKQPFLAAILRQLFAGPARKFARQILDYDDWVRQVGISEASCQFLQTHYVNDLRVHGREHIPASGPLLVLSNHPGMTDTLGLFAAIDRADLHIIALHRPFLASLTNVTRHLFYISDDHADRTRAVRRVSAHLRAGGAVLTFPAGKIEPDPDMYSGASKSLCDWTDSSGVFLRFARDTKIVPALVSGVVWEKAARHWLTRVKRTREEREKLATALQLLVMVSHNARPTTVHVRFAKPITFDEIGSTNTQSIHQVVMKRMHTLIENPSEGEGVSIL